MKELQNLEEGFWTSHPKQRHINRYSFAIPLTRLGIDVNLEGICLVHRGLVDGRVELLGDLGQRPMILRVLFWEL